MKKLQVGYCVSTTFTGGMERHVLALIDNLNPEECDVTVFCGFSEWLAPFFEELKGRKVRLCTNHSGEQRASKLADGQSLRRAWARAFRWLLRRLSLEKMEEAARNIAVEIRWIFSLPGKFSAAELDVLHFHAGRLIPLYWPLMASRLIGIPTRILTLHNAAKERLLLIRAVERVALRSVHCIITPSDYVKRTLPIDKRAISKKVVVIPHGIEIPEEGGVLNRSDASRKLNLSVDIPVVGMVGRLVYLKGFDLLIRSAPALRASVPGVKIVLIGEGPEEYALRRLAEKEGVSDIVVFAGYRSDARRLVQAFDLLVAPSRDEGVSLSIMEAMACGKPVVAAKVGGIPDIMIDGVTGILIPSDDVPALSGALVRLLTDAKEAEEMGRAGRERVESVFQLNTMLFKTFSLYNAPPRSFLRLRSVEENSA